MLSRVLTWVCPFLLAVPLAASPGLPVLPPFDGTVRGEITPFGDSEEHRLTWSIQTASPHSGKRTAQLRVEGARLRLAATVNVDAGNLSTTWEIQEGFVDLGAWLHPIARRHAPALETWQTSGELALTGRGSLAEAGGALAGQLRLNVLDTRIADPAADWSVEDVTAEITLPELPELRTPPRQRIAFTEARIGTQVFSNGLVEFQLTSASTATVQTARMAAYGGILLFEPFDYDLNRREINAVVAVESVELKALQPFFSDSVKEADGRLSGRIQVLWSPAGGLRFGRGELSLTGNGNATLRLARASGFMSSKVPPEFDFLPWAPRFLRNLARKPNPAYAALQRIEVGEETLTVETLAARLEEPDAQGNSKTIIQIVARPTSAATANAVKRLRLNVNINAPLAEILKYGADGRLSFGE